MALLVSHFDDVSQVLADARAVDELKAAGHDTRPLCGLAFAVKDNIDVVGYPTVAGTPALSGTCPHGCHINSFSSRLFSKRLLCSPKAPYVGVHAKTSI